MLIDWHSHHTAPAVVDAFRQKAGKSPKVDAYDSGNFDKRLAELDQAGIDFQLVCQGASEDADQLAAGDAIEVARLSNDVLAGAHRRAHGPVRRYHRPVAQEREGVGGGDRAHGLPWFQGGAHLPAGGRRDEGGPAGDRSRFRQGGRVGPAPLPSRQRRRQGPHARAAGGRRRRGRLQRAVGCQRERVRHAHDRGRCLRPSSQPQGGDTQRRRRHPPPGPEDVLEAQGGQRRQALLRHLPGALPHRHGQRQARRACPSSPM